MKTDDELITEAKALAKTKNCIVSVKPDCFLVYRKTDYRMVFVGRSKTAKQLLSLVKKA